MTRSTADFIERRRRALGLGRRQLVERMGYRNVAKGLRHLLRWTREGRLPGPEHLPRLAAALDCGPDFLRALVERDRRARQQAWRAARARDPRHHLALRLAAAIYKQASFEGTEAEALEWACALAACYRCLAWLDTASGHLYVIDAEGRVTARLDGAAHRLPTTHVGGRPMPAELPTDAASLRPASRSEPPTLRLVEPPDPSEDEPPEDG